MVFGKGTLVGSGSGMEVGSAAGIGVATGEQAPRTSVAKSVNIKKRFIFFSLFCVN